MRFPAFLLALTAALPAQADAPRTNWFGDPYFRISQAIADCPEPLGPLVTEEEALGQSHHRNERGLRCYLEKRCRLPNSFAYDKDIAARIEKDAARIAPRVSTLWILVQGRRVWAYGCVDASYRRGSIERALRNVPEVEVAIEQVRVGPRDALPYRVR